jgi:putative FmdB family regulatory protein
VPIYEYQCQACEHRLERLQGMSDPLLTICPECGGALRKLFSAPAFQFKGSGWYVTDYARKGGDKGEEKSGEKGGEKKSNDSGSSATSEKAETKESKAASTEGSKSEKEPAKAAKTAGA